VSREVEAFSTNVGRLLVKAGDQVPIHNQVSLRMKVVGLASGRPVRLLSEGEVVRVEPPGPGAGSAIAV